MKTICGIDCSECGLKANCGGCEATNGHPSANRVCLPNAVKATALRIAIHHVHRNAG